MILEKYLADYYLGKITNREIADKEFITEHKVAKILRDSGYKTYRDALNGLAFDDRDLRLLLAQKYNSLKNRCLGKDKKHLGYAGLQYLTVFEWVSTCNSESGKINSIWGEYINGDKNLKLALSIDRINNRTGYTKENIQFVTNGFNSWKSTLTPIEVIYENKSYYFMSGEEGSRHFNVRRQTIGECLLNKPHCRKEFTVFRTTEIDVLSKNNCRDLQEYYETHIK